MNEPARVFVVDDSPDLRLLYRLMLEQGGYDLVGEAGDCAAALAQAPGLEPDIIVLDVLLPDAHGFDVARLLRSLLPDVTIVLCSGAGWDVAKESTDVGADGWLDKTHIYDLVPLLERLMTGRN